MWYEKKIIKFQSIFKMMVCSLSNTIVLKTFFNKPWVWIIFHFFSNSCHLAQRCSFKEKWFDVWIFYCFPFQGLVSGRAENFFAICWSMNTQIAFRCSSTFFHFCIFQSERISISGYSASFFLKELALVDTQQVFYPVQKSIFLLRFV